MVDEVNLAQSIWLSPATFRDYWTMILGLSSVTATAITLGGFLAVFRQLGNQKKLIVKAEHQLELLQASEMSQLFVTVMDRWTDQYKARNNLLAAKPTSKEHLEGKYDTPFYLLNSKEWEKVRPILNFFEFLGVLLSNEKFDHDGIRERIFTLVTVDIYPNRGETIDLNYGEFYSRMRPYLEFLRDEYRPDIYRYYDEHLLPVYISYLEQVENSES